MNNYQNTSRGFHVEHRRAHPLKVIGIMLGCILALLLIVYIGVAVYFSGRFMPNSEAGGLNLSFKTSAEAEQALNDKLNNYSLSISGQGLDLKLSAAEAGLAVNTSAIVDDMLSDVNPWMWPFQISSQHDESQKLVAGSSGTALADAVSAAVQQYNERATAPTNATISYDTTTQEFTILPESVGTALDANAVTAVAEEALSTLSKTATITADQLQQPSVKADDERLTTAIQQANVMVATNLTLTMDTYTLGEVNPELVAQWITIDDNANATLDETKLTAWVDQVATDGTTVGTARTYTRPDGKEVSVNGGVYGWEVDRDALLTTVKEAVAAGSTQSVAVPTVTYGDAYNGPGAQDWGKRYIDIDLTEQHARFYDDSGALAWESDIVTGQPNGEYDTPSGVYWMNQKESPSTLNGYAGDTKIYETVVQYWMPFVGGAIGLHDAEWQSAFGGTRYADGYGSHGCVNLPPEKAAELYNLVQGGDVVVCHW